MTHFVFVASVPEVASVVLVRRLFSLLRLLINFREASGPAVGVTSESRGVFSTTRKMSKFSSE